MPTPPGPSLHRSRSPLADPRWQRARLDEVDLAGGRGDVTESHGDFAAAAEAAFADWRGEDLAPATKRQIGRVLALPEAQLDRFLMHVAIGYPDASAERDILKLVRSEAANVATEVPKEIPQDSLFEARQEILAMHMAPEVEEYIIQLIMATREPAQYGEDLAGWLEYGASPRGTISLDRCARAHAWIQGRDFVSPDDVQDVLFDVLRHRILLSFEAEASGITPDQVLETIRQRVPSA